MAVNQQDGLGIGDEFLEQILAVPPPFGGGGDAASMALQLGTGGRGGESGGGYRGIGMGLFPLGLNLEHGFLRHGDGIVTDSNTNNDNDNTNNLSCSAANTTAVSGISERDSMQMSGLFPRFARFEPVMLSPPSPSQPQPQHHIHQFHSQPASAAVTSVSQPPAIRPRVRARRGQATDPHSIAERLRRERITERMKALQELVPSCNKTDKAAMLDEIVDYVKFLRLQVKVLSMSRLGAAGAVAQLVSDATLPSIVGDGIEGRSEGAWEKWSSDGMEEQVAKLMEDDIGAAMQFLQSKALCIMPISLASAIFGTHQPDGQMMIVKRE